MTYALTGTDAALFTLDTDTGELTFTTAPDFESPADNGTNNVYDVIVTVSDGSKTDVQSLAITVTNENDNDPVITNNGSAATNTATFAEMEQVMSSIGMLPMPMVLQKMVVD